MPELRCEKCGTKWQDVDDPAQQSPCPNCELERLQAIVAKLLDTLEYSEGAILDAIASEDSLDGWSGYTILGMIWKQFSEHGVTSCVTSETREWLLKTYGENGRQMGNKPISMELAKVQAIVAKLPDWVVQLERLGSAIFHEGGGSFSRIHCSDLKKEIREAAEAGGK